MPTFSNRSSQALLSCDSRLIKIASLAIEFVDFSVTCGHRTHNEQAALYAQGRTMPGPIVTYKKAGESIHNTYPSRAIDVVPFPIDWTDVERFCVLAGVFKYIAWREGIRLVWGGEWTMKDYPHFQLEDE